MRPLAPSFFASLMVRLQRRLVSTCAAVAVGLLPVACVTPDTSSGYGVQPNAAGFVPARIAILPCQAWPTGAHFAARQPTSVKEAELADFCTQFDQFVVGGFSDQPFMKGYSPRAVAKSLAAADSPELVHELAKLWAYMPASCPACTSPPTTYSAMIQKQPRWLAWLSELSGKVKHADAVLLPFIVHANEQRYKDRGLSVVERGLGASLLLIDTSSGALLWAGGRSTVVPNKSLASADTPATLEAPSWTIVTERVFNDELWRDFPGRLIR